MGSDNLDFDVFFQETTIPSNTLSHTILERKSRFAPSLRSSSTFKKCAAALGLQEDDEIECDEAIMQQRRKLPSIPIKTQAFIEPISAVTQTLPMSEAKDGMLADTKPHGRYNMEEANPSNIRAISASFSLKAEYPQTETKIKFKQDLSRGEKMLIELELLIIVINLNKVR